MEHELYTKSIHSERFPNHARHISVMSRHTEDDGITPDKKIVEGVSFDEWLRELAPPDKLVGAYYREELDWDEYERQYLDYLRGPGVRQQVHNFAKRCTNETITLLCVENEPDKCHRRILAEELHRLEPSLKIVHK